MKYKTIVQNALNSVSENSSNDSEDPNCRVKSSSDFDNTKMDTHLNSSSTPTPPFLSEQMHLRCVTSPTSNKSSYEHNGKIQKPSIVKHYNPERNKWPAPSKTSRHKPYVVSHTSKWEDSIITLSTTRRATKPKLVSGSIRLADKKSSSFIVVTGPKVGTETGFTPPNDEPFLDQSDL